MKKLSWVLLCLVILNMAVIFMFSAQNGEKSSEISQKMAEDTVADKNAGKDELKTVELIYRKSAHFSIFCCLGFLTFGMLKSNGKIKDTKRLIIISLIICVLYAASDELHQNFVDGRDCRALDVLIDSVGSSVGICAGYFVFKKVVVLFIKNCGKAK